VARAPGVQAVQAIAETAVVLGTGLVSYLSLNAVTHPVTLTLQLTHLWPWPSEGTVRVIALGFCLAGVATSRYLRATASRPGRAAPATRNDGVKAERLRRGLYRLLRRSRVKYQHGPVSAAVFQFRQGPAASPKRLLR
jgi:hypothetical protein